MHNPLEKYKSKRRERHLAQRGEACNSTGVLTRLVSSGAMCVFLCDSVMVLSRLDGSGKTPRDETYTFNFLKLVSQTTLPEFETL